MNIQLYEARLTEARHNTDRLRLVQWLGLRESDKTRKKTKSVEGEWWFHSPFGADSDPSFHIQPDNQWCDWASGQERGGGSVELVQEVLGINDCYTAVRAMLEAGVTFVVDEGRKVGGDFAAPSTPPSAVTSRDVESPQDGFSSERRKLKENQLLTHNPHDLLKAEFIDFTHPIILERITEETACEFEVGYYEAENSRMPLNGRIIFKLRGVREQDDGSLLTGDFDRGFLGRALNEDQERIDEGGKYKFYPGFNSSLELYGLDQLLMNESAIKQAKEIGHVVLVEGCFDMLRLVDAGVRNAAALFTGNIATVEKTTPAQLPSFQLIAKHLGISKFVLMLDRGYSGTDRVAQLLHSAGFEVEVFGWDDTFQKDDQSRSWTLADHPDSTAITDPGSVPLKVLRWWRRHNYL